MAIIWMAWGYEVKLFVNDFPLPPTYTHIHHLGCHSFMIYKFYFSIFFSNIYLFIFLSCNDRISNLLLLTSHAHFEWAQQSASQPAIHPATLMTKTRISFDWCVRPSKYNWNLFRFNCYFCFCCRWKWNLYWLYFLLLPF